MGFYSRVVLPRLVTCACGTKPILRQRQKVVPRARGRVLEIGFGAGQNLPHYDRDRVTSVVGVDPCDVSWRLAAERVDEAPFDVEFVEGSAEALPLQDGSFDSVLLTFALCTIPHPDRALAELKRVLRPGGELVFCEHGRAPDPGVARWQDRVNPLWRRTFGGCNLNRDIAALIETAGFSLAATEQMYLPGTPRIAGFNTWGVATGNHQ